MSFREVRVFEIQEVLRLWLAGEGLRLVERMAGVDRKTVRRYVAAAAQCGLERDGGEGQLTDDLLALVVEKVRPGRTNGYGAAWRSFGASTFSSWTTSPSSPSTHSTPPMSTSWWWSGTGRRPRWSPPTANPSSGSARWPTRYSLSPPLTDCSRPPTNSSWREVPIASGRSRASTSAGRRREHLADADALDRSTANRHHHVRRR